MPRIVLAMSGGVDSSVAAWLLRRAGHDVTGVFMRHGAASDVACLPEGGKPTCCSAADAADARRVAERLEIPFYAIDFEDQFGRIIDHFVDQYAAGRTPNPCILCNTWLKFGKLFEYADGMGAEYVATGHYARVARLDDGQTALLRGIDPGKDQAYALFGIDRRRLPRILFPVGERRKTEIRQIAAELGLDVADKRDSQEICFVPDQDHAGFVRRRRPELNTSGEVVTKSDTRWNASSDIWRTSLHDFSSCSR